MEELCCEEALVGPGSVAKNGVSSFQALGNVVDSLNEKVNSRRTFVLVIIRKEAMDCMFGAMNNGPFDENILRCPFLRNINKPTNFLLTSISLPVLAKGARGPIFEDSLDFWAAFKLFHGKDGIVPLTNKPEPAPQFNPLAANAATISLSALGGPLSFGSFNEMLKNQKKPESLSMRELSSKKENLAKHEANGNEWLESGNCPIAKSYRAVNNVLPLVAKALQPPPGMKFRCPPAIVAARAALARTAFVKKLRPQPLHEKMIAIALLGMAVNVPLGVWREHTVKFSLAWFTAVHAAVPFVAMLRKSVLMPKAAMALTIAASILGQVIGSRAERYRMKAMAYEMDRVRAQATTASLLTEDDVITSNSCGMEQMLWSKLPGNVDASAASPPANVCF